jgi:DUF1365 family protein
VKLLTHLTYFGYCFNPISIYYQLREVVAGATTTAIDNIVVEVSNTPWIEQHNYVLHESIETTEVRRDVDGQGSVQALWNKEFHVSPFMEMDYRYDFTFSEPREELWVRSKMIKQSTKEVWFTASFELKKIAFSPLNLLYVLTVYPVSAALA